MPHPTLADARAPFALAIDIGSSSVRAMIYDADARPIVGTETRKRYRFFSQPDGTSITDPDVLLHRVVSCIDRTMDRTANRAHDIGAVGMTCFWHSLLGVDADGTPLTPVLTWADSRSRQHATELEQQIGLESLHDATGCRPHSSYWPAKLRWLRDTTPDMYDRVTMWMGAAEYIQRALLGATVMSLSMASGTGLADRRSGGWHPSLLQSLRLHIDSLPELVDRHHALTLTPRFASRWPSLGGRPWFPALGDGATANVGCAAVDRRRVALTVGTSGAMRMLANDIGAVHLPPALWHYRLDRSHTLVGGALSNGGNALAWLKELTGSDDLDASLAPDGHGLTIIPFLAGERSPSWDDALGATISGLRLGSDARHLRQAMMEATAYRFGAIFDALRPFAHDPHELMTTGGSLLSNPTWMRMISDTLDRRLTLLPASTEASARGVAICALHAAGFLRHLRVDVPGARPGDPPDEARHRVYTRARHRQEALEQHLAKFSHEVGES